MKTELTARSQQRSGEGEAFGPHCVVPGDEVYFSHDQHGALYGEVAAVGEHGCTIKHEQGDTDGYTRQPWSALLGHRSRKARRLVLVDKGDDGGIAVDEEGKRVYIRGDLPDDEAQAIEPVHKALSADLPNSDDESVLAAALHMIGSAWLTHLSDGDARREAFDIAREAADARLQAQHAATLQAFLSAITAVAEQAADQRSQYVKDMERMHALNTQLLSRLA